MIRWICVYLSRRFDGYLLNVAHYRQRVLAECSTFPEGDIFPYVFPVYAYANIAIADPARAAHAREQILKLIGLAIPSVVERVKPLSGDLVNLKDYSHHAVHLGQLNLALGYYRLIGGDDRFEALHETLSRVLHDGLMGAEGRPLWSYPGQSWPFDTIPCLLSLKLRDHCRRTSQYDQAIERHLQWIRNHATDPQLGLPYSHIDDACPDNHELPRGCDISLRLMLMPYLNKQYADTLYQNYLRAYWRWLGPLGGFSEWPRGLHKYSDIDSGPIVLGFGMAATGFGIGATIAMGDSLRWRILSAELRLARAFIFIATSIMRMMNIDYRRMTAGIKLSPEYFTGFLFGDVCLFYAASWHPWYSASINSSRSLA